MMHCDCEPPHDVVILSPQQLQYLSPLNLPPPLYLNDILLNLHNL